VSAGTSAPLEATVIGVEHPAASRVATSPSEPMSWCLHHFFERQCDRRPAAPAIVSGNVTLSYGDIERRANQLARHLRQRGVEAGDLVGLFVERSPDAIVAILSILKAGGAYLPIEPSHPPERIRHILDASAISVMVSESTLAARAGFDPRDLSLVELDARDAPWQGESTGRLSPEDSGVSAGDLAYVLYTSGSTGRPKGVMTEHRQVTSFVRAFNAVLRLTDTDRVFQGFSLSFDGSVEEMWMAFSNGAALVVPPRGAPRFGDELAHLITAGKASVFSTVPTALATISLALPSVRVLIVSGERCSKEAVQRWATPERRMLNVYGPTETTVNATVAECRPNRPVTIGKPLSGYTLHVLDEHGRPVGANGKGELFIAGPGVARGYLGQPELTQTHFVNLRLGCAPPHEKRHDRDGDGDGDGERAYRTGDLVSYDDQGDLLFHGRLDGQIKLRGFRIELAEIEAVLGEHPAIRSAAVTVAEQDGKSELCAYAVATDPAREINRNEILTLLHTRLPSYMIPTFLDVVATLPTLTSGKVNRKELPLPVAALVRTDRTIRAPRDALETSLLHTFRRLLRNETISIDDDFFVNLGGYSLLAAQLVSNLRNALQLEVSLRDIYHHPTIAGLAAHLRATRVRHATDAPPQVSAVVEQARRTGFGTAPRAVRNACVGLQALGLYVVYGVMTLPYMGTWLPIVAWRSGRLSFPGCLGVGLLVWTGVWPALLVLSVAMKWLLIGRYRAGAYPLWGWYYLRWWLVRRFQLLTGSALLTGTPLLPLYLRAMGARIGKGCTLDTPNFGIFDLLSIGDDTSIGGETQVLGYRVEQGQLLIGSVEIGSRCFIGTHAALGIDVRMGDEARLDDQSLLPDGASMAPADSRRGSPARPAAVAVPETTSEAAAPRRRPVWFGFLHLLALYAVGLLLLPTAIPGWMLIARAESLRSVPWLLAALPAAGTLTMVVFCLWLAVLNQLILPRVRPGTYRVQSVFYVRKWAVDLLMQLSRSVARPLYTTIYLPSWLRLMGATIDRRAEISTVSQISPKLTHIGAHSFFADGSMIGGRRIHRGLVELAESRIGRRSFVGNGAILPVGAQLGDDCLLGCLSAPPAGLPRTPDGTEWLGSPSFALPHRPRLGGFVASVTHEPTRRLIAQRLLLDALRIVMPATLVSGGLVALSALVELAHDRLPGAAWLLTIPLSAMAVAAGALACVVLVKRLLIGTFVPTIKPLWSTFVWLNEALNGSYETIAAPVLTLLLGTPYCAPWLRLLGCRIGRRVYLETTLFSEFDLVQIGDDVALNAGAVIQNHLFEDRIMKASVVKVGDRCSVGNMAVVLYDTEMQADSAIGPLSLLMKGETLAPRTQWVGIPTAQVARQWTAAAPSTTPSEPALARVEGAL